MSSPERNAARLREQFGAVSARALPRKRMTGLRKWLLVVAVALASAGAIQLAATHKGWSWMQTARHVIAAPNCNAARLVGLAPAARGTPGYYRKHDADLDGLACEPWPR